jgi:cyclophilin family peptidyl-prolyl cis-trans isomerase
VIVVVVIGMLLVAMGWMAPTPNALAIVHAPPNITQDVVPPPPPPPPRQRMATEEVECQTTKGPFRISLFPEESPKAVAYFKHMVTSRFWSQGKGVAFFRVNEWITQFGQVGKEFKLRKEGSPFSSFRDEFIRDRNPFTNPKQRVPFKRGDMNLLGGTQFTIVKQPNRHMGVFDFDTVLGRVSEVDMRNVVDNLYAYNDIIDHPNRGPGPDQTLIYEYGWAYLDRDFPLVDRITSCAFVSNAVIS